MKQSRRSFLTRGAAAAGALAVNPLAAESLAASSSARFGKGLEDAQERANLQSRPSDLQITNVEAGYLRGSRMLVKVSTNQDIVGYGEGVDAVSGAGDLVRNLGRRMRGDNPLNVHRIFEELRRGGVFGGAQGGVYVAVLSALETALWDLSGKALGVPVYQLLGGKFRDRVRVYCDTALYRIRNPTPEQMAESALETLALGFNAIKFDLDQGGDPNKYDQYNWTASPGEIQRMVDQMTAVREAVGPNIDICADMHGRYDTVTGQQVARRLEPVQMMFLEEPIPAENIDAYRRISEETITPICAGENFYLAHGFREALEENAVDIVMPDLQKVGGLGEGQRIANLANLYYAPFAPHMVASYLGAMASAHVCASVPNFLALEWQIYYHTDPSWQEIVTFEGESMVEDGYITVSNAPGIGVEPNEEALQQFAPEGATSFFG
jgi:galactonate dehydratase